MVDRYLASPRYGERWGQHWLDAAGYADSNGYFHADSDRPLAWRYRDYVIRAINDDKPFDRFIQEQLAGDELAGYVPDGDVTPEMVDGWPRRTSCATRPTAPARATAIPTKCASIDSPCSKGTCRSWPRACWG